jgi:hypothetical protein
MKNLLFLLAFIPTLALSQDDKPKKPSKQDTHRIWVQNNTPLPNHPTGRKIKNNSTFELKPKWYVPQQSPSGMVTPQFRYQTNDGGAGFNGPGAFQRNY